MQPPRCYSKRVFDLCCIVDQYKDGRVGKRLRGYAKATKKHKARKLALSGILSFGVLFSTENCIHYDSSPALCFPFFIIGSVFLVVTNDSCLFQLLWVP